MSAHVIPGGRSKGAPLETADSKDIEWWLKRITEDLEADPAKKFADRDRAWCKAAHDELERRARGGKVEPKTAPTPAAQQRSQALARTPDVQQMVLGTFDNASAASKALLEAAQKYHLVSPATIVGRLPEGCEVAISLVQIDPYGAEVYNITGDRKNPKDDDTVGLDRVALARIGGAAGVTWEYSRQTDDGSHPHFCAWEAVALFPTFDLSVQRIPGNVDIDTREDGGVLGAAAEEIRSKADKRRLEHPDWKNDGGDSQLLEIRKFLRRHAESKAMNKAIGNKGVRRSYKRSELNKPFAVARLLFTGHSEDPEARREFRQMIGQRFMGATAALYGGHSPALPVAPPQQQLPPAHGPVFVPQPAPPIGTVGHDEEYETSGVVQPSEPQNQAPAQQQPVDDGYDDRGSDPNAY